MSRLVVSPLVAALLLAVASPLAAQEPAMAAVAGVAAVPARDSSAAARATMAQAASVKGQAPVLDGRTDDAAWLAAPVIDQFLEYEPSKGKTPRFRTEVRIVYDERNMYVLARMFDPAPDSIISLLSRRDVRTASEQLKLVIDSYNDNKTAFQFITNPAGVKRDFYVSNDRNEDPSWDAVWEVATRIDSLGWVAEFRIPFSQIRYAGGDEHTFGLLIVRDVARTGQRISWPLLDNDKAGYVSQAGSLGGIGRLPSPRRLEILPYVVAQNSTRDFGRARPGGLPRYDHPNRMTAGADLKVGLSSNLTLDATVNPDFGQVEADPAELNLGAFETFFSERRPFFLEGAGIFNFCTAYGDIDTGCTGLFYSRRIGRNPQLSGLYGDPTSATSTPIAAAAKVTGRLANGISVGFLDAVTQRVEGVRPVDGELVAIEPATNYSVARLQKDHGDGRGEMGLMLTGVNRSLDPGSVGVLRSGAYSGGLDLRRRFFSDRYEMRTYVAMSDVRGSADAIASLQRNSVHGYQRPDDDIAFDPARTSLRGDAERISFSKFGGGVTRFQSVYQRFSPGFETNDLGYLQRADEQLFRNWLSLNFNTPNRLFRRAFFNFNAQGRWTTDGLPLGTGVNQNMHIQLPSQWWMHFSSNLNDAFSAYDDRAARGGPAVRRSPSMNGSFGVESDGRKTITGYGFVGGGQTRDGDSWHAFASPGINARVSSRFSTSLGLNYSRNAADAQYYGTYGVSGGDTSHYTFARLDQTTIGVSTRLNFTATPNLSFQFYGEPFVSNGTYADWKELSATPRADAYEERYQSFRGTAGIFDGFNFRQFRSNAVLRWEYRPGSTLFAVWQQGRSNFLRPGDPGYTGNYEVRRDYDSAFRDHPNNTFLVKWSYWINP